MKPSMIVASKILCLAITFCKTAFALHLPEHPLQQSLFRGTHAVHDTGLDVLEDPQKLDQLFRFLTTDDAIQALDRIPSLELINRFKHIVLGHHNSGRPAGSIASHSISSDHPASLEISMSTIGGYPVYHTPIAIGSPAQPFNAWLNLNLNGLYVRSTACSKYDCGRGFAYNPKRSTTRKSSGHRFEVHPKDWTVGGKVSTDTLHLVSLKVENTTVGEIDKYEGDDLFYYVMESIADGAFGLAPPRTQASGYAPLTAPNPLHELMKSHVLKHNTLTLTLPNSTKDSGSLKIGLPPHAYEDAIHVPFGNTTNPDLDNTWHVPLDSVSLEGQNKLRLPLVNVYGRLDLEPAIRLPPSTTEVIYEAIEATPNSLFHGASIDCRAREKLPDLVLNIGGHDVALTRDEYSSEQAVFGHKLCVVAILPSEGEGVAVLGTNLLGKYHVIIDIDGNQLGLSPRVTDRFP